MNKKRILSIITAGILTLSILTGCGKAENKPVDVPVKTEEPAVVEEAKAPEVLKASAKDFDANGYKAELTLTYEADKIVKVEFDEIKKDGSKKSTDEAYAKMMKDKSGISPAEAYAKLTETALKDDKVDEVTGATQTKKSFEALYSEAKAMKK